MAHTCIVLYGSSKFLGRDQLGHSRTTVGLTRLREVTVLAGIQTICQYIAECFTCAAPSGQCACLTKWPLAIVRVEQAMACSRLRHAGHAARLLLRLVRLPFLLPWRHASWARLSGLKEFFMKSTRENHGYYSLKGLN